MPTSRGYPIWFILPDDFLNKGSKFWEDIENGLKKLE